MSKTLLSIMIEELETVRLICQQANCRAILEVPVSRFETSSQFQCTACGKPFEKPNEGTLTSFANALKTLKEMKSSLGVEFVIPAKDKQ